MVDTMWLASTCADFHIMGEACLVNGQGLELDTERWTYPHGTVQGSCNFIVSLQSWAAPQDLGKPELANSSLHVLDFSM